MRIENFNRVAQLVHEREQLLRLSSQPTKPEPILHAIGFNPVFLHDQVVEGLKQRAVDTFALFVARETRRLMEVIDAELIELGMSID